MIAPETQRDMAQRMKAKIAAHAVDHISSVTAPTAVVDIICDAIHSVPALQAKKVPAEVLFVNCPIVSINHQHAENGSEHG